MNKNGTMKKLQTAILQQGIPITISRSQFYSAEQNRFVPILTLSMKVSALTKIGIWKDINYEIIRTSSQVDALLCLVDIYKAVRKQE